MHNKIYYSVNTAKDLKLDTYKADWELTVGSRYYWVTMPLLFEIEINGEIVTEDFLSIFEVSMGRTANKQTLGNRFKTKADARKVAHLVAEIFEREGDSNFSVGDEFYFLVADNSWTAEVSIEIEKGVVTLEMIEELELGGVGNMFLTEEKAEIVKNSLLQTYLSFKRYDEDSEISYCVFK